MRLLLFIGVAAVSLSAPAADLKRSCSRCHSLAVVRAQRLTRDEWADELVKMERMGASIRNREALLDYLARAFGPSKRNSSSPEPLALPCAIPASPGWPRSTL